MKTPVAFGIGLVATTFIWLAMWTEGVHLHPLILAGAFLFSFLFAKIIQYPKNNGRITRI